MKHLIFYSFLLAAALLSCKKETPEDPVVVVPPPKVPIFLPGDTTFGAAYAEKNTYVWTANTYCKHALVDSNKLILQLFTYTANGSRRETLGLALFSKNATGVYQFEPRVNIIPPAGSAGATYGTWSSDGDVVEDYYLIDSTDAANRLTITHIDLVNKRVEGRFHATFDLQPPRRNPANPLKASFTNGRFWAVIRE
ncbi:MAG: hypothetical protein SFV22_03860 [Saprospiraceae bacterium]|nr:hypothetical protein [Saprospiraceae bacterium]